jgi:restriction endonuclease S subunit
MLLNEKYYLNSQAFTIKSKNDILKNEYLWYYLDNNKEQVFKCGRGTAQKAIDIAEFKSIKIPIPSIERQKEIVEYCDFNDTLIQQLQKEIEQNKKQANLFISGIVKTAEVVAPIENELLETHPIVEEFPNVEEDAVAVVEESPKPKKLVRKIKLQVAATSEE